MTFLLTRGRAPFLVAVALATAWFTSQAVQVGVEKNNESLTGRDPTQHERYAQFKATFGSDEDLLLTVTTPHLLEPAGLTLLDSLTHHVGTLDGVHGVYSLTTAKQIVGGAAGAEPVPLIAPPFDAAGIAETARAALDRNPDFTGWLVSPDRQTAGLLIEIDDRPGDDEYRAQLIDALRSLMAETRAGDVSLHLTGIAVQKHDVTDFLQRDQHRLIPLGVVILAVTLAAFFRRALGVALPLAVTAVSVTWTLGTYHLAGLDVNAITALLPPVLMVLSLAVGVHLLHGWLHAPLTATDRVARIMGVVRHLLFPCFFCSLTTALGFSSLALSDMPAVQQFGVFAAFGVLVSFAIGMTLVPAGLTFLPPPRTRGDIPAHRLVRALLEWTGNTAAAHPRWVFAAATALTAASLAAIPLVQNNTDLVRFLKRDAPLYRDTMFIDQHLTGTNALEFVVARRDGQPLTALDDVQRLAAFEAAAHRQPHVTTVTSMLAVIRQLHRAESGGTELSLPGNERDLSYCFDLLQAAPDQGLIRKMVAPDFTRARVSVRIHAIGSAISAPLVDALLAAARESFGAAYRVTPTGAFYQVVGDSTRLVRAQVKSLSLALALVFVVIGLLFRSARLTAIAFVPNVIPIIWTGGLMGAFGIDLSVGTAMIASAVLGLVVDDTIHYLTHYRRVYAGDAATAVRRTNAEIGAALVMNNLTLVLGFWVGCFGSFKPTIYFSLLSGVTMISAMLCDLLVTPACLMLFGPRRFGVAP